MNSLSSVHGKWVLLSSFRGAYATCYVIVYRNMKNINEWHNFSNDAEQDFDSVSIFGFSEGFARIAEYKSGKGSSSIPPRRQLWWTTSLKKKKVDEVKDSFVFCIWLLWVWCKFRNTLFQLSLFSYNNISWRNWQVLIALFLVSLWSLLRSI